MRMPVTCPSSAATAERARSDRSPETPERKISVIVFPQGPLSGEERSRLPRRASGSHRGEDDIVPLASSEPTACEAFAVFPPARQVTVLLRVCVRHGGCRRAALAETVRSRIEESVLRSGSPRLRAARKARSRRAGCCTVVVTGANRVRVAFARQLSGGETFIATAPPKSPPRSPPRVRSRRATWQMSRASFAKTLRTGGRCVYPQRRIGEEVPGFSGLPGQPLAELWSLPRRAGSPSHLPNLRRRKRRSSRPRQRLAASRRTGGG